MEIRLTYLKKLSGLLDLTEIICSICVLICDVVGNANVGMDGMIIFTAVATLICAVFNIFVNLLNCVEACCTRWWILIRLITNFLWAICFFISIWLCVSLTRYFRSAYAAAAVFSALAFIALAIDVYIHFKRFRIVSRTTNQVVQESRVTSEMTYERRY